MSFGQSKEVVITINTDGSTVVEANNFNGVGCKDATKALELVLAGNEGNTDTKPKPDFYAQNSEGVTNTGF